MGPLASKCREIIVSGSFEFPDVSPEMARATFRDITSAPEFVPHLVSVEFVRGEPSAVGACWDERRIFRGGEVVERKTITQIDEEPHYSVNAGVEMMESSKWTPLWSQTFTFTIQPVEKSGDSKRSSCKIGWTIVFLPSDVSSKVISCCCRSSFEAALISHVEEEIGYYYVEALRRTVKKAENGEET